MVSHSVLVRFEELSEASFSSSLKERTIIMAMEKGR